MEALAPELHELQVTQEALFRSASGSGVNGAVVNGANGGGAAAVVAATADGDDSIGEL